MAAVLDRQGITPAGPAFACDAGPPGSPNREIYATEPSPDMDLADLRTELFWTIE